jgi:exonuclease VII small subunit
MLKLAGENFKLTNQTVTKRKGFRVNLQDLKDIIEKMNENQLTLEKNIARAILLQKKSDLFFKLKQVTIR